MTSVSLATEKPRIWRWEGRLFLILFGCGLILWPFLSFGAIFMFDSPLQNRSDELHRYTVAYFIWSYPVTYAASCLLYFILRKCRAGRVLSCLAWGLPVAAYFVLPFIAGWHDVGRVNSQRVQLLYRTDHAALLAACREVMTDRDSFTRHDQKGNEFIDPKNPKLPRAIVGLHPRFIGSGDDSLSLVLHGEISRLVVVAYSEQFVNTHTNFSGNLQLIPGLWFTDQEFSYQDTVRTEYIKNLKAMKPADVPAPTW